MLQNKKTYIAQMLLEQGYITQEQLDTAIALQKSTDKKIGRCVRLIP